MTMDGVILFVDDKVHHCYREGDKYKRSPENSLFEALRKDHPVLGVHNLNLAERAIRSIGSFSVIILDWIFDEKEALGTGEEDALKFVRGPEDRTLRFLEDNEFYSLIYVYSTEDIQGRFGAQLTKRFGERIRFQKKPLANPAADILDSIKDWQEKNQNLSIPLAWTATINQSIQRVFSELANADPNWIQDLAGSAKEDAVNEDLFIIEILQSLLTENIVQNTQLRKLIADYLEQQAENAPAATNEESIARLFNRLFYTRLTEDAPIMTGDICQLSDQKFGIIISPECDVRRICAKDSNSFEMLVFQTDSFRSHVARVRAILDDGREQNFKRERFQAWEDGNASQKEKLEELRKIFNQNEQRFHVLPSFPMLDAVNQSVVIEFSLGRELHLASDVKQYRREYKLNTPFLQQLRQRYLAYQGRMGVPSLPISLRNFNLK